MGHYIFTVIFNFMKLRYSRNRVVPSVQQISVLIDLFFHLIFLSFLTTSLCLFLRKQFRCLLKSFMFIASIDFPHNLFHMVSGSHGSEQLPHLFLFPWLLTYFSYFLTTLVVTVIYYFSSK